MIPNRLAFKVFAPKAVVVAAAAFALTGCSLLSTPDPVQLYRFGAENQTPVASASTVQPAAVALRRIDFPEAAKGDRLLGVTGNETAYIKGARWVSPAEILFNDSLENAFNARPDKVRLIGRRDPGISTRVLSVDVTTFETRYDAPGGMPTVVITARARMTILPERTVADEQVFTVSQPATENRVSAIVSAFDIASRDLNSQIVDWTATAAPAPAMAVAPAR